MNVNQPTKYTWSYSSIGLFKQCPQKYYRIRVKKDVVEPESDAMRYGTEVHKAAEDYIKEDTPIPAKFAAADVTSCKSFSVASPLEYLSENSKKFKTLPGILYNYFSYLFEQSS